MLPALGSSTVLSLSSTGRTVVMSPPWAQDSHDFAAQTCLSLQTGTGQESAGVSTEGIRMSYFGEHFWVSKTHS